MNILFLDPLDLPALFAAAQAYPDHTPEWLTEVLDSGWASEIGRIWSGGLDAYYRNDDSVIDMALAAAIWRVGLGPGMAIEAVMCRRLRTGRKVEKVDPARRTDYLLGILRKLEQGREVPL
jgi:hypothetical protein